MDDLQIELRKQITWIDGELNRVKKSANESGFNCISSVAVIVQNYRKALKQQREYLTHNLEY